MLPGVLLRHIASGEVARAKKSLKQGKKNDELAKIMDGLDKEFPADKVQR